MYMYTGLDFQTLGHVSCLGFDEGFTRCLYILLTNNSKSQLLILLTPLPLFYHLRCAVISSSYYLILIDTFFSFLQLIKHSSSRPACRPSNRFSRDLLFLVNLVENSTERPSAGGASVVGCRL